MIDALTTAIGLSVAALIIWLIRKDRLHVNHGLGWVMVALVFALLGFAPSLVDDIALQLGVGYPPIIALTMAISILVIKTLLMDIERSHLEMRNQRLTQRLAMLEADLSALQDQVKSGAHFTDSGREEPDAKDQKDRKTND